jgi:hypothetical protein
VVFRDEGAFGVDSRTKLIHAMVATPANVADSTVLPDLLHGQETRVWGDQAYRGQRAVIRESAPKARDFTNRRYRHRDLCAGQSVHGAPPSITLPRRNVFATRSNECADIPKRHQRA